MEQSKILGSHYSITQNIHQISTERLEFVSYAEGILKKQIN